MMAWYVSAEMTASKKVQQFDRPHVQTLSTEYTGVAQFSKPVLDMWSGDPDAKTGPFGISYQ